MEATTGWLEGQPWEIAWGELLGEGARWKRRQGGRRGKNRESSVGKERDGSDGRVDRTETVGNRSEMEVADGGETVQNSLGRAPLGGSETEEVWTSWTDGKPWEIAWGELGWEGARWKRRQGGRTGKRGKK